MVNSYYTRWFWILAFFWLAAPAGCQKEEREVYSGYAEGEYVFLSSSLSGALTRLHVRRGDRVAKGDPLFELDREEESASREEAAQQLEQAKSVLENLRKGKRTPEISAIQSQLAEAEASVRLSRIELGRREQLFQKEVISKGELDQARAAFDRDTARVGEIQSQLKTARLGARSDEISAAEAQVESLRASLRRAEWRLSQKRVVSPNDAPVDNTFYREGEWVPAGRPVVSLLPPENLKIRFFIPETQLTLFQVGQEVAVSWDDSPKPIVATVRYISSQPEYSPPVIYSNEARSRLVFMVEAWPSPEDSRSLRPGQPVDVFPHPQRGRNP